jgi:hypothetical protein
MIAAHHDKARRQAAAAHKPLVLEGPCRGGDKLSGGVWRPVEGPFLRTVHRSARNTTGVPGISYSTLRIRRKDGSVRIRRVFYVNLGLTHRRFCLDTLGKEEAWRRAVRLRAQHEMRIRQINEAILTARTAGTGAS